MVEQEVKVVAHLLHARIPRVVIAGVAGLHRGQLRRLPVVDLKRCGHVIVVRMVAVRPLGIQLCNGRDDRLQLLRIGIRLYRCAAPVHRLVIGLLREDALGDQLIRNAVPALHRRRQRTIADDERAAAVEAVRFCIAKADRLCQRVRVIPLEVTRAVVVAEHAQQDREERRLRHLGVGVKLRLAHALGDTVCIDVADIGVCPCGYVGERMLLHVRRRVLLRADKAHHEDERLRARQLVAEREVHAAVRVIPVAADQPERMERLGRAARRRNRVCRHGRGRNQQAVRRVNGYAGQCREHGKQNCNQFSFHVLVLSCLWRHRRRVYLMNPASPAANVPRWSCSSSRPSAWRPSSLRRHSPPAPDAA